MTDEDRDSDSFRAQEPRSTPRVENALEKAPNGNTDLLKRLRRQGWMVAVHNDYREHGTPATFWLFTHPSGVWAKGEGVTDADALAQVEEQARERRADGWRDISRDAVIEECAKAAQEFGAQFAGDVAARRIADRIRALKSPPTKEQGQGLTGLDPAQSRGTHDLPTTTGN